MDVLEKSREMLTALTTFPYYVVVPPTTGHASWQEASAIAFALECIGSNSKHLPSRLGATRVTVNPKASSVEDAVTRYSRTAIALKQQPWDRIALIYAASLNRIGHCASKRNTE